MEEALYHVAKHCECNSVIFDNDFLVNAKLYEKLSFLEKV